MSTKSTAEMVADAIRHNLEDIRNLQTSATALSMADASKERLIALFGYSEVQAAEVVAAIKEGLDQYASQRQKIETEADALASGIRTSLDGYSDDERRHILANTLTSLQVAEDPTVDTPNRLLINASLTEDQLITALAAAIETLPSDSGMGTILESLDPETIAMIDKARDFASEDFRLAAAIQIYILQKQGQIKLTEGETSELPPQMLGALAGASIDALHATADLKAGRIDLTKWQRILKYVFGALFMLAFCIFSALAIMSINLVILDVMTAVFGFGFLGFTLAVIAAIAVSFKGCELQEKGFEYLVDKLSAFYDKAIVKITAWAKAARDKIAAMINSRKTATTDETDSHATTEAPAQVNTDDNNTAAELPGIPALA